MGLNTFPPPFYESANPSVRTTLRCRRLVSREQKCPSIVVRDPAGRDRSEPVRRVLQKGVEEGLDLRMNVAENDRHAPQVV